MEQLITNLIDDIFRSFDLPFCITVNIATYILIKAIIDYRKCDTLSIWKKRLIFVFVALATAAIYCATGSDYKIIFNSIVIAPVSWSWLFKPICSKLKIDYSHGTECEKE